MCQRKLPDFCDKGSGWGQLTELFSRIRNLNFFLNFLLFENEDMKTKRDALILRLRQTDRLRWQRIINSDSGS
jgi:hypothetical protein